MPDWDVVVIGAGAAGLMSAARCAERGRRVLLLEKNRRAGVKILMSGGTRCNITQSTDRRGIIKAYGDQGSFLHSPLAALGPQELIQLLESEGVATKVEETGKIFPVSDKAQDVLDAFLRRVERSFATLALEEPVMKLARDGEQFQVTTPARVVSTEHLIITTGGKSYPGSGTTGDGYAWMSAWGHTIVTPRPALVPLTTSAAWVPELRGITLTDVLVRVAERKPAAAPDAAPKKAKKRTAEREFRSSFLFTHFGLSGPAVMNASRDVSAHPRPAELDLICDFLPRQTEAELNESIKQAEGRKTVGSIAPEEFPRRFWETLMRLAEVNADTRIAELGRVPRERLVQQIKRCAIPLSGTRGYAQAEVTAGGVALGEVNSSTMESRIVPGLYLAGEILDLDGPIGGYNFQAAFSTGWLAGEHA